MAVLVRRKYNHDPGEPKEVELEYIWGFRWDNAFGKGKFKHNGYRIYGYMDYRYAHELGLNGGEHGKCGGDTKVQIREDDNDVPPYIDDYKKILEIVGPKPKEKINKSVTGEATTKRILRELSSKGTMKRGELRSILLDENYSSNQILGAIRRMTQDGRIRCEGNSNSRNQLIMLGDESRENKV